MKTSFGFSLAVATFGGLFVLAVMAFADQRQKQTPGVSASSGSSTVSGPTASGTAATSTATAMAGGREIRAAGAASVSIEVSGAKATVHLGQHVLEVETDKLVLDRGQEAALPKAAKKIEVAVADEMLTVIADGTEVLRAKLDNKK